MEEIITKRERFYEWITQRKVYHTAFWLFLLIFLTSLEYSGGSTGFWFVLTNNLIRLAIFAAIVYFNLNYLIPNYLTKKEFFRYLSLLVLTIIIITPIENIILYFKYWNYPSAQIQLVHGLNWTFVPKIFIAGLSTILKIINDWLRHLREKQELQTQTMQSELRFLKSQINPHFLFNTLNNLYALTLKKSEKAPEIVIKLSEMMRYMLYECNEKRVPLSKEVSYIRNYLDLEALRQGQGVRINFSVQGEIANQQIAPLMFIPFLENSFKHGVNHSINKGFVDIFLNVEEEHIHFFIENSKSQTLPKPNRLKSGGIGLVNVRRRLELLYPDHYELNIENSPNTYAVSLELDLVRNVK